MEWKNLKVFTNISFITAIATILVIPISLYLSPKTSDERWGSILVELTRPTFHISVFGIPLSIVSMFSKETLAKRIFALIVNLLPISLLVYGLTMEFIDEFLRTAP